MPHRELDQALIPTLSPELIDSMYLEELREPSKRAILDNPIGRESYGLGFKAAFQLISNHLPGFIK